MHAGPRGVEDLLLKGQVALGEETADKHECLQGYDPVVGLVEALGDGGNVAAVVSMHTW